MLNLLLRFNEDVQSLMREVGILAKEQGMKAYLVGGPVRDLYLKRSNLDLDIVVEGKAIVIAQAFAKAHKAKVVCYPAFGTATVSLLHAQVDFATARKETYARPGAFPAVVPSVIRDDLFRRDFTINAMAISINPQSWGTLVDPFGGLTDVRAKRIRVLHDLSFVDDPTRILRAARFKGRLGFSIEQSTLKLLKHAVASRVFDSIKPQRYQKELNKIRKEEHAEKALANLRAWGVLNGQQSN